VSLFTTAIRESNRDLSQIWRRYGMVFWACAIVLELCHYLFVLYGNALNPEWGAQVADFVASILASGTYILVIPLCVRDIRRGTPSTDFLGHTRRHFNQVMIESLRVVAKVIVGLLLLVIPGIIWSIRLSFVPLVAQFDPQYIEGKVDALRQSENLVKGNFLAILGISVIFFVLSLLEYYKYAFEISSPLFFIMVALNLFLEVYVYMIFFSVYENLSRIKLK
jgi:hypothetical protein